MEAISGEEAHSKVLASDCDNCLKAGRLGLALTPPWEKSNSNLPPWIKDLQDMADPSARQATVPWQHSMGPADEQKEAPPWVQREKEFIWQIQVNRARQIDERRRGSKTDEQGQNQEREVTKRSRIPASHQAEFAAQRRGASRLLPRASDDAIAQASERSLELEIGPYSTERSWPDPPEKYERRICSSNYSAMEIHGFYGLIDDGSDAAGRMLIVHVPRYVRGYFLDIKQGDTLPVYHVNGKVGGRLTVLATGRHKYYAPGRKVTTCTVCVPEEQWAPFRND